MKVTGKILPWVLVLICFELTADLQAQICSLSVAGLNQSRRVMGPVHAECPGGPHSAPFGNWGVTSNFGKKQDDHQFQGWCHDSLVCDNYGNCRYDCRDGWWEWNSCTDHPQFWPPNCWLYNTVDCMQQVTTQAINVHGTTGLDISVSCPFDSDGDGACDTGGCKDVSSYGSGTNWMTLYELDPFDTDELVQTMYFPSLTVSLNCTPWSCDAAGSAWVSPTFYDSPPSPARVDALMAMVVNYGTFVTGFTCEQQAQFDPRYNCF